MTKIETRIIDGVSNGQYAIFSAYSIPGYYAVKSSMNEGLLDFCESDKARYNIDTLAPQDAIKRMRTIAPLSKWSLI